MPLYDPDRVEFIFVDLSSMATRSTSIRKPVAGDSAGQPAFVALKIPLRLIGALILLLVFIFLAAMSSWSVDDPSFSYATDKSPANWLGFPGAVLSDIAMQFFGLASLIALIPPIVWGWAMVKRQTPRAWPLRLSAWLGAAILSAGLLSFVPPPPTWPLPTGLGGLTGSAFSAIAQMVIGGPPSGAASLLFATLLLTPALALLWLATGPRSQHNPGANSGDQESSKRQKTGAARNDRTGFFDIVFGAILHFALSAKTAWRLARDAARRRRKEEEEQNWRRQTIEPNLDAGGEFARREPVLDQPGPIRAPDGENFSGEEPLDYPQDEDRVGPEQTMDINDDHLARLSIEQGGPDHRPPPGFVTPAHSPSQHIPAARIKQGGRLAREAQGSFLEEEGFHLPELSLLSPPVSTRVSQDLRPEQLEVRARQLEGVLEDFGVKGDIINVRPGPVVTLYELEPAPGIKSSRVISLADDIARSMSAISARVAVVPGRNAIGIELPNANRETVFLREMLASKDFERVNGKLPICLGKTIGGEPVIADLARMPHLLIAGTTGSGKSVAVNTMILSLLYRMTPEQCRLIMIDPKMLELSVYDGIPHLLSPVVTDPAKAVTALKWAVREMEDRYRKMSKIGVRNIDGFNARVAKANNKGETITRTVQTGFDRESGEAIYESESFDLEPLPFIVVIVDEMADLMMVAGKDIEGAIQRLAQMARAAGIHLIMATQRPSVDVITGTIKANFPTRISFQVTSKIDSRTILGEQGAEQLLGMGDMLYMAGGGRLKRLHGPFVADSEVEDVVTHLKEQGAPDYLESVTDENEEMEQNSNLGNSGDDLYDKAVNIVLNDHKASTSYIQRRLSIGYNRAATLIERMENEGVISAANHAGKREVLVGDGVD